jgi:hypothetical protein
MISDSQPASCKRELQVERERGHLERAIALLGERIPELYSRLNPVLRSAPTLGKAENGDLPALVPLADYLYQQAAKIEAVTNSLSDVLERLEI